MNSYCMYSEIVILLSNHRLLYDTFVKLENNYLKLHIHNYFINIFVKEVVYRI